MPIATLIAMKPTLEQSSPIASQRLVGTALGAAIAAAVLIAMDVPNPTDLDAEGRRIFFTFAGIAIALLVTGLATLLQKPKTPTHAGGANA